jgi:hypothetical protein
LPLLIIERYLHDSLRQIPRIMYDCVPKCINGWIEIIYDDSTNLTSDQQP